MDENLKKEVKSLVIKVVRDYLKTSSFTDRKLTDTPTDSNQVVNRRFVTQNGTSANRPTSSVTGLQYFDTDVGKPIYWNGTSWVDPTGSVV